jgi:tetratricopeptide (TPR) repeat protein
MRVNFNWSNILSIFALLFYLCFCPPLAGQDITTKLSLDERRQIINDIGALLIKNYIFEDAAQQCSDLLKERFNSGKYDRLRHPRQFAEKLTSDIYTVLKDRHVRVQTVLPTEERLQQKNPLLSFLLPMYQTQKTSAGIAEVKIMIGNIGYLNITSFEPLEISQPQIDAAMKLLEHVDALIIDLRENNGGMPGTVQYICSHFFDRPLLLNSFYWRRDDYTEEFWSLEQVSIKKLPQLPLFILTSHFTFSAAEEFAYNLKTRQRATTIGETTGGGANPGFTYELNSRFNIFIPIGRAINPLTASNWEGVGIAPDIKIESSAALGIAMEKARQAARIYREKTDDQAVQSYMELGSSLDQADHLFGIDQADSAEKLINTELMKCVESDLLGEWSINAMGYYFLQQNNKRLAIAVLIFNTQQYPRSSNVYDSLGEAYFIDGRKNLARQYYLKSLELNPANQNALIMLKKLDTQPAR